MVKNGRTQFAPTVGFFIIDFKIFTPTQAFPFEKLRIFRDGGPRQRWMRCRNIINGENKQYCRAGACSCRLAWNLINGEKRANTVRPYGWIFKHGFKIRTPTNAFSFRKAAHFPRRGTASAVDEVLEFNQWRNQQHCMAGTVSLLIHTLP